jgi:hypothetical protein
MPKGVPQQPPVRINFLLLREDVENKITGLTLRTAAKRIGVGYQVLFCFIRGRTEPRVEAFLSMVKWVGYPLDRYTL